MRYRRRTFIPYFSDGRQVGHLIWQGDGMEAHTAEGKLIGKYPTRREAAAALWAFLKEHQGVRTWSTQQSR
jgi:hypothetical protein